MWRAGHHRIWTHLNRSKWRSGSIPANKDMRSPEKSRGKVLRRRVGKRKVVKNQLRKSRDGRWKRIGNLSWRQCSELSGESERGTIKLLSRRDVRGFSRCGEETEEDPGELAEPVNGNTAGTESRLEAVVKLFNKAIGLRMVGGGELVRDVKVRTEGSPKSRSELRASSEVMMSGTLKRALQ